MTNHTKGPWSVNEQTEGDVNGPDGKAICVSLFHGMETIVVSGAEEELARISMLEAQANAMLIAAAPDLLLACQMIAESRSACDWLSENDALALPQLMSAIAKATQP